jgi:hypothetical protein
MAALAVPVSFAACSRANPAGSVEAGDRSSCTWEWSAPETLFVNGASFGFGGMTGQPHLLSLGAGTALVGDRMSTYADTETQQSWPRLLGVSFDAKGNAALIAKPAFMSDVAGYEAWALPGPRGTIHFVWTTLGMNSRVVHATTDGVRWSAVDSGFSVPFGAMTESNAVAAAGDDVIVALPAADEQFSDVVVGIRMHGAWDVARFSVPHKSVWGLPLAAAIDESGATIMYFHMLPSMGGIAGDTLVPGLYARHRPWGGGPWGPETRVLGRPGFAPVPLRGADGVFHVFWRGMLADSSILHHAATHDFNSWQLDQITVPTDVHDIDVAPEDAGVRIVMLQTDDVNGLDEKYARILSATWGPGGFSALETAPIAKAGGPLAISPIARDTEVVVWPGMRLATQSTKHPGKGPSRWQSYVPAEMLARHVRRCAPPPPPPTHRD